MNIEGKKNLELLKRALDSHLVSCCANAVRSSDKQTEEKWDPEIKETSMMLDAVDLNLKRYRDPDQAPSTKLETVFFR